MTKKLSFEACTLHPLRLIELAQILNLLGSGQQSISPKKQHERLKNAQQIVFNIKQLDRSSRYCAPKAIWFCAYQ